MKSRFLATSIIALLAFSLAVPLGAQSAESDRASLESLREILADTTFGGEREGWSIRMKQDLPENQNQDDIASWLDFFSRFAAHAIRIIAIAAGVALIVVVLVKMRPLGAFLSRAKTKQQITTGEHPESAAALLRRAQDAFRQGHLREAWMQCYLCVLAAYAEAGRPFPDGATEYECLRAGKTPEQDDGFGTIVENRVNTAYRGMEAHETGFAESVLYCERLIAREGGG